MDAALKPDLNGCGQNKWNRGSGKESKIYVGFVIGLPVGSGCVVSQTRRKES
jgi:hypothetical protein